jgi:hypothetical protein
VYSVLLHCLYLVYNLLLHRPRDCEGLGRMVRMWPLSPHSIDIAYCYIGTVFACRLWTHCAQGRGDMSCSLLPPLPPFDCPPPSPLFDSSHPPAPSSYRGRREWTAAVEYWRLQWSTGGCSGVLAGSRGCHGCGGGGVLSWMWPCHRSCLSMWTVMDVATCIAYYTPV